MVFFLTTTLVLSCLGMAAIIWLKRYELKSGRVFVASVRPALGAFFSRGLFWLERVLPSLVVYEAALLWRLGRAALRTLVARGLLLLEQGLEQGLRTLRRATTHAPVEGRDASPFLREVAEHKKKLQEERSE